MDFVLRQHGLHEAAPDYSHPGLGSCSRDRGCLVFAVSIVPQHSICQGARAGPLPQPTPFVRSSPVRIVGEAHDRDVATHARPVPLNTTLQKLTGSGAPAREFVRLRDDHGWWIGDHATLRDGVWVSDRDVPSSAFSADAHQTLLEIEDQSLWFRWRNEIIGDVLQRVGTPAALWDIGAGNGVVSRYLETLGITPVVVEPGVRGTTGAAKRGIQHVIQAALEELELPAGSIPSAGAFDVLEHLENPEPADGRSPSRARSQRPFHRLSPSVPGLWSEADIFAGHHRRYRRKTLLQLMRRTGFASVYISYRFAAVLPQLLLTRALPWRLGMHRDDQSAARQLGRQSSVMDAVGRVAAASERYWDARLPVPLGTSLIVAARRV